MPAPYGVVSAPPPPPAVTRPAGPVLSIVGGNGDVIALTGWGDGYGAGATTVGIFGQPDNAVLQREIVGDGAFYAGTRYGPRPIDLVVTIESATVSQQIARKDRLQRALDRRNGEARLVCTPPEGGVGAARSIGIRYSAGWDGGTDPDFHLTYERIPFTFAALDPLWRAVDPITVTWGVSASKPFLSATEDFFPVILGSSTVLGAVELNNPGDEDSPAVWRILGPGGPVSVAPGAYPEDEDIPVGVGFTLDTELEEFDVVFVRTPDGGRPGFARSGDDVNVYDLLGTSPKLWPIPPGVSTAQVRMIGAEPGSEVLLQYWPRFKRGW